MADTDRSNATGAAGEHGGKSVHFTELVNGGEATSSDQLGTPGNSLSRDDPRTHSIRRREREKIGHRRVDSETGEVTYKRVPTKQIIDAIQFGITSSIGSKSPDRDLLVQDFDVVDKFSFPSQGTTTSPSHPYGDFRFKCYAPVAFRYFRDLFHIKPEDFLSSVCANKMRELSNPGASGSIFYLTIDDQFILKTVQLKEAEFLTKLLPGYYMNLNQNPRTLLPKFFGLYCYQSMSKNIRLVAMNNILPSSIQIHQKYDLKGSTYKRKASKAERLKPSPTLKDLDFLEENPDGIFLESETYDFVMKTISRDCLIMDYSLLIGVHNIDRASREQGPTGDDEQPCSSRTDGVPTLTARKAPSRQMSTMMNTWDMIQGDPIDLGDEYPLAGLPARNAKGERLIIYMGLIDILQNYRLLKKFEHAWKSVLHDGDTISVHRPGFYAQRMENFLKDHVFKKTTSPLKHSPSRRKARELKSKRSEMSSEEKTGSDEQATTTGDSLEMTNVSPAVSAEPTAGLQRANSTVHTPPGRAPLVRQETSLADQYYATPVLTSSTPAAGELSGVRRVERLFASTPPPEHPTAETTQQVNTTVTLRFHKVTRV